MRSLFASAVAALVVLAVAVAGAGGAGVKDPIEGDAFHALIAAQDVEVQHLLESACARYQSEVSGFLVTGPLDPLYEGGDPFEPLFHSARVISQNPAALERLARDAVVEEHTRRWRDHRTEPAAGFRGLIAEMSVDGERHTVLFLTENQNRWLVWLRDVRANDAADVESAPFAEYARAVSRYLNAPGAECPQASTFGLPAEASFYAPRPPYVIQGYDNYKALLRAHEEVETPFARGILGFIPGDSLRTAMMEQPPETAWPNKEEPLIQHEYREFLERGGNTAVLRTLSAEMIPGLAAGEYFYCVGLSGRIRFGYEIPREEIDRIEEETGRELPRANHAFLFPGEPVLTAGAFVVREGRIAEVSAHSGHYFYSNVTATIRDDVVNRSDEYLMTLGHFLAALERLGVDSRGIVMSKM